MKSKYEGHTPGPWEASPIEGSFRHRVSTTNGQIPLVESYTGWGHDSDHANARLIADAPTLLEENKRLGARVELLQKAVKAAQRGWKKALENTHE